MPRLLDELGDVGLGFVRVGIDAENHDALLGELAIDLDQPGHVEVCHRAIVAQEYEHDAFAALEAVEHQRPAVRDVFEREIREPLHHAPIDRKRLIGARWVTGKGGRREDGNEQSTDHHKPLGAVQS